MCLQTGPASAWGRLGEDPAGPPSKGGGPIRTGSQEAWEGDGPAPGGGAPRLPWEVSFSAHWAGVVGIAFFLPSRNARRSCFSGARSKHL